MDKNRLLHIFIVLCFTTLLSAQDMTLTPWQEIDTLIVQGHYTSAYEKSEELLRKAKRKGDSRAMLKAVYKQQTAAAAYQEEHIKASVKAYQDLIPALRGVDKSIAYTLLSVALDDYKNRYRWRGGQARLTGELSPLTIEALLGASIDDLTMWSAERFAEAKRLCYEAALAEEKALKATKAEDYDLLTRGDTLGLRLRPTLYDVVMHATLPSSIYLNDAKAKNLLYNHRNQLYGTAEEFASLCLPSDTLSYELWQLSKLQELTRHHQATADAAVRAHIDHRRMEALGYIQHYSDDDVLQEAYIKGLERIAESYRGNATEQAMFLFKLADYHKPTIYKYSNEETIERELKRAARMERYVERIREVAPDSEWAKAAEALYRQVTHPYLRLESHKTLLPGREGSITITLRSAGSIAYRIVPRHAGETTDNFNFKEVIGRKSVGKAYEIVHPEYPNPYIYKEVKLPLTALDAGDYFVIATNDGRAEEDSKRSSITAISVSNLKLSVLANEAEGEYIGMVIDATTGEAVKDCEVTLMEKTSKRTHFIEEYKVDEMGYFTVPSPTGKYRNLYLVATDGASRATYTFRYADFPGNRYSEDDDAATLFTFLPDRYTYEPGDTVRFALIAYCHDEEGSRVKSQLPIGITLQDARYKEMASMQGVTDEWGRFDSSFVLPEDVTTGRFRLQATDSLSGRSMYHYINVEAFKAPTFKAEIERPKGTVRFGDSLMVQGTATTFTEMPVGGAKVKYEVMVTDMNIFGRYPLSDAYLSEHSGTTTTDEKGNFCIPLEVRCFHMLVENATHNYIITAHITDSNGETQTAKTNFVVGHRTKYVDFARPAIFRHGDSIAYSLRTLNGERVADKVTLRLSRLQVPQSTEILRSVESGREQWSEERTYIHRTEQTASDKDSHLLLTEELPYGTYRLTATYTDGDKQYSEVCHLELWGEGKGSVSSYALYQTRVKSRDVLTGDTAVLYVGTRYSDVYLHYYIQIENRVVDKGTLCLTDEMTSLRIPIKEEWRGGMQVDLVSVKENVVCINSWMFSIEDRSDELNVQLSTLRSYLEPGEKEQCTIRISDHRGHPVQSSFILSIYDAALDSYGENYWDIALASRKYGRRVQMEGINMRAWDDNTYVNVPYPTEPKYYSLPEGLREDQIFYSLAAPATTRGQAKNRAGFDVASAEGLVLEESTAYFKASKVSEDSEDSEGSEQKPQTPPLRTNLNHTALFLPNLHADEQGQATFTLTAPDLLTQWHVKGMAYTKDLKHGRVSFDFVTRKTLMVQPHVPRFLYEGDTCEFTAKVTNSGDAPIEAVVKLETGGREQSQTVSIAPSSSTSVSFPITAPSGKDCMTYRITAESLHHSDGEQATITVLPRRTLVTETMALYLNGKEKREFVFDALKSNRSETLEHHSLKLDMVSNPLWYVIEALPPLCEESNPSYEQLFHRYYASSLALKLMAQYREIEGYADFYQRDSLMALQQTLLNRLAKAQHADGGWAWMEGFGSSPHITRLIAQGIGELEGMGCVAIAQDEALYIMLKQGVAYLDRIYQDRFDRMARKPKALGSDALHYLYMRSMFPELPFEEGSRTAYEHYRSLLLKDKTTLGTLHYKAMKMLTLIRMGKSDKALKVAKVVHESSLSTDEMGIYWRGNSYDYGWDSNPITTQALLIEAFVRLNQPADIVGRMQQWLLKQKQTTHWESTIATAHAVHALMVASPKGLLSSSVEVRVGGKAVGALLDDNIRNKRLGIVQKQWIPEEIHPTLAKVSLERQAETPAWGSMTWQYYEEADKVKASGTGLSLKCTYYKVETKNGKEFLTALPVNSLASGECRKGDRIRVRMQFAADRAMDYVELHMHRPAAFEPTSTRSGYTYERGLAYYRSIENERDVYYLQRIDKSSYTIECDFWVSQSGTYSCGPSTIQCMYAPAFMATSEAASVNVD